MIIRSRHQPGLLVQLVADTDPAWCGLESSFTKVWQLPGLSGVGLCPSFSGEDHVKKWVLLCCDGEERSSLVAVQLFLGPEPERLNFFPQSDQAPTSTPIRSRSSISAKMFKRSANVPFYVCQHARCPIGAN